MFPATPSPCKLFQAYGVTGVPSELLLRSVPWSAIAGTGRNKTSATSRSRGTEIGRITGEYADPNGAKSLRFESPSKKGIRCHPGAARDPLFGAGPEKHIPRVTDRPQNEGFARFSARPSTAEVTVLRLQRRIFTVGSAARLRARPESFARWNTAPWPAESVQRLSPAVDRPAIPPCSRPSIQNTK